MRVGVHSDVCVKSNVVFSRFVRNFSKVRVEFDNGVMQISFKYLSRNHRIVDAKGQEAVGNILSRIKQIAASRRQDVLCKLKSSQFSVIGEDFYGDELEEDAEVQLMHGDELVRKNMPNIDAWAHGSFLKIGSRMYEVEHKHPLVKVLTLPRNILGGFPVRPHFEVEYTNARESCFEWYHSVSEEEAQAYDTKTDDVVKVKEQWWVKVNEGMIYWTSRNDIGRRLKVVVTPRFYEREGSALVAESQNAVLGGPEHFPFQERHLYTQHLTDSDSIRCLTYNILASMYVERKKFPYCTEVARDRYYRRQLLIKELLGYNGDILCLQEVQEGMFQYDILPVLQSAGFDGFWMRKSGRRSEGLACFFRASKFKVISHEGVPLNEIIKKKEIFHDLLSKVSGNLKDISRLLVQHSVLQIVLLEHIENSKRILVANTHLYSNKDAPDVRLLQSALCVGYIEHLLKSQDDFNSAAVLFCGDFNSVPHSSVLKFLLEGSFKCCPSWTKNSSGSPVDTTIKHSLTLDSACGFPAYTNYTEDFKGCLDYIFYSPDSFTVEEIVPIPSEEAVSRDVGLPSELFPSDHIPLICTLNWK